MCTPQEPLLAPMATVTRLEMEKARLQTKLDRIQRRVVEFDHRVCMGDSIDRENPGVGGVWCRSATGTFLKDVYALFDSN